MESLEAERCYWAFSPTNCHLPNLTKMPFWRWLFSSRSAQTSEIATLGPAMVMIMIMLFYTFGENLEILAYLFWPSLITLGLAFDQVEIPDAKQTENPTPVSG
jgi:hypothetical protein